jgi:paraquat-inducible protein B
MAQAVEEAMAAKESADKCNDKADLRKPQDQENVKKADQAAMDAINSAEDAVEEAETGEFPQIDKDAADALREMLNEAFEEVEQRKRDREESQRLSEQAKDKAEQSQTNDGDLAKEQALDATEMCKDAAEVMNPYSEEDRDALEAAIDETMDALNEVGMDDEVQKAMDELKELKNKMRESETLSSNEWGIWGYGSGWVQTSYGKPLIFTEETEAEDYLRTSGGRA